jgi:hypothetical protein
MKTILTLRGAGNRGKSTTLGMLIEMIKVEYAGVTFEEAKFKVDITMVITINGKKVGIETQGDPNSRLGASLKRFIKIGCKVIICASRSYGSTVDLVNAAANSGYQIKWFEKTKSANVHDQAAANKAAAKEVFNAFRSAIDA